MFCLSECFVIRFLIHFVPITGSLFIKEEDGRRLWNMNSVKDDYRPATTTSSTWAIRGASLGKDANFLGRIWTRCSKKAISCWHFAELVKWDMNRWQANTVQGTANKRLPTPLEGRSVKVKRGEKDRDEDKMHVFRWRIPIQWQLLDYENMLDEDTLK